MIILKKTDIADLSTVRYRNYITSYLSQIRAIVFALQLPMLCTNLIFQKF